MGATSSLLMALKTWSAASVLDATRISNVFADATPPPTLRFVSTITPAGQSGVPGERDRVGFGEVDEDRLFRDEDETFLQEVQLSLDSLDVRLDSVQSLCTARQHRTHVRAHFLKLPGGVTFFPVNDLSTLEMTWNVGASYFRCKSGNFAISSLKVSDILADLDLLSKVELRVDLLVLRPLCNKEGISGGSLPYGRVEAEDKLDVEIVDFGEEEDSMDGGEWDSVICALPQ